MHEKAPLTITTSELYRRTGQIFGFVRYGGESFVIEKRKQPTARLIPGKDLSPGKDGQRRFSRGEYVQVTPGEFRSRMADLLAQVRYGGRRLLITYYGKVVALVIPLD